MYEKLSTERRIYNAAEQTMYIIYALKNDSRFRPGILYVESLVQSYQRDVRLNPSLQFQLELEFDEIGVVIDEQSED